MSFTLKQQITFFLFLLILQSIKNNMEKHCIGDGCFSDVTFELDDGHMKAHRAILVARCDVMRAMLAGDFREAHSSTVSFEISVFFYLKQPDFNSFFYSDCFSWRNTLYIPQIALLFIY